MARKIKKRELFSPRPRVIGAGKTELYYLKHLKTIMGLNVDIKPSLFGNESMSALNKLIDANLNDDCTIVCLYDEDVSKWNIKEGNSIADFHKKYDKNPKVILGCSMPSIEYWFLLHFEKTNRHFGTSDNVIKVLRKYIHNYGKHSDFLENRKWVEDLVSDNKMENAYALSKEFGHIGESYSDVWKAIDAMRKDS